jgi:hypothetical protein
VLPPPPGVLIFAQGRSGSTLLVELLNSLPDVVCEGEILERRVEQLDEQGAAAAALGEDQHSGRRRTGPPAGQAAGEDGELAPSRHLRRRDVAGQGLLQAGQATSPLWRLGRPGR